MRSIGPACCQKRPLERCDREASQAALHRYGQEVNEQDLQRFGVDEREVRWFFAMGCYQTVFLEAMGKTITHCGPIGAGQATKLCNQILCAGHLLAACEALVFARKNGVDSERMLSAVSGGAAGSWVIGNLAPRMVADDFAPGFMIDLQQKDLRLVLEAARETPTCLPGTALVSQLLASNQARGGGTEGTQALIRVLEELNDLGS